MSVYKLAVLDYGIGGLDVWRTLRARYPALPILYLSDSGYTPYGELSASALARRLETLAYELKRQGVSTLLVACNAASSALPPVGAAVIGLPTLGIIESGIKVALRSRYKRIGVIGGERTIASRVYCDPLSAAGVEVSARVAQPLSLYIEAGDVSSLELQSYLDKLLKPFVQCQALLLACTHYPALTSLITARLPDVTLLDPAFDLIARAEVYWNLTSLERSLTTRAYDSEVYTEVYTTGSISRMREAARAAFNIELTSIKSWTDRET